MLAVLDLLEGMGGTTTSARRALRWPRDTVGLQEVEGGETRKGACEQYREAQRGGISRGLRYSHVGTQRGQGRSQKACWLCERDSVTAYADGYTNRTNHGDNLFAAKNVCAPRSLASP